MDYPTAPLSFRVRKAARYARLYGPRRTLSKIQAEYHMTRDVPALRRSGSRRSSPSHVGIIGCGRFAFSTIAHFLTRNYGHVVRAAMDVEPQRACSLHRKYKTDYYTTDARELLDDPAIDLIFISSNHASHAEYAIEALRRNKAVHIEKPHVVAFDQLAHLCDAMATSAGKVALGFNRPHSRIGHLVHDALASQTGAAMLNWFVAGHELPADHWYYRKEEGGRVLGNLCHWTDFVYCLVDASARYPIRIVPASAELSDCDIAVSYVFGDGTIAAITFSAKGHTFEGVREIFAAHRGDVLIAMKDFKSLVIENGHRRTRPFQLYRDHGHEATIKRSYEMVRPTDSAGSGSGCSVPYVWETAELFLRTKQALEESRILSVEPFAARDLSVTTPSGAVV